VTQPQARRGDEGYAMEQLVAEHGLALVSWLRFAAHAGE